MTDPLDVSMSGDDLDDAADKLAAEEENALAAEAEYEHVRLIVALARELRRQQQVEKR